MNKNWEVVVAEKARVDSRRMVVGVDERTHGWGEHGTQRNQKEVSQSLTREEVQWAA